MRNLKMLFAVLLCCYTVSSFAFEVGGVVMPDTATVAGKQLGLNGAGLRGEGFHQALLRVWLGEEPAEKGLREGLLGED